MVRMGRERPRAPTSPATCPGHTDLELIVVLSIRTGDMPAPDLDSQQIADVLTYLREAFGQYTGEHP